MLVAKTAYLREMHFGQARASLSFLGAAVIDEHDNCCIEQGIDERQENSFNKGESEAPPKQ